MNKVSRIAIPPAVQGLLPAFFCIFSGVIDRLYLDIDSFLVSMTCNGLYGSGAVCPVIHPLLAIVLGRLAPLAPSVDWFTLISRVLVALTAWWIGMVIAWCIGSAPKRIFCLVSFSILLFRFPLFNANYTVHCAFFAMAGVTTLVLALRRAMPRGSLFWAAWFLCLAILWRPEGAALMLPFLLLDLVVLALRHALPFAKVKKVLLPALIPPLLLVAFSALLPLFLDAAAAPRAVRMRFWKAACLLSVCCLCLLLIKNRHNYHVTQLAIHAGTTAADDTALLPANDPDTVYLWDSMSMALYMTEHYMMEGKLPSTAFVRQNLAWGEWNTSGQPFYQVLLADLDLENPMQCLLTRPHTYLVVKSEFAPHLQTWLQEHYTPTATLQQTATVNVYAYGDTPIWQAVEE